MLHDLRALLLGDKPTHDSRRLLIAWLRAGRTGLDKLRAGVPAHRDVGDKTGGGAAGESNDVGIPWSPRRPPVRVAVYYDLGRNDLAASRAVPPPLGALRRTGIKPGRLPTYPARDRSPRSPRCGMCFARPSSGSGRVLMGRGFSVVQRSAAPSTWVEIGGGLTTRVTATIRA